MCTNYHHVICLEHPCASYRFRIDWNPPGDVIVPLIFSPSVHADGFVKLNLSALGHIADVGSCLS